MPQNLIIWITENWAELASIIIASAALFYAARAYHSSKDAANAARKSDHTNLKVGAEASLAEAHRSFNLLLSNCQKITTDWEQYTRKHLPVLSVPSAQPTDEISRINNVRREGAALLNNAKRYLANIDNLDPSQLVQGIVKAKGAAVQIEGLVAHLQGPPNYFD